MASTTVFKKGRVQAALKHIKGGFPQLWLDRFRNFNDQESRLQQYLQQEHWDKAISLLADLLKSDEDNPQRLSTLAEAYLGKGDLANADTHFRKALQIYEDAQQVDAAIDLLTRVANLQPGAVFYRERRVRLLFHLMSKRETIAHQYRETAIKDLKFLVKRTSAQGIGAALPHLKEINRLCPEDMETTRMVVTALMLQGDRAQAAQFLLNTAQKLLGMKEYALAQDVLNEARSQGLQNPEIGAFSGLLDVHLGEEELGLHQLQTVYLDHPRNVAVLQFLAEAELFANRPEAAAHWLVAAYEEDNTQAIAMVTLAREMLASGNVEVAFRLYKPLAEEAVKNDTPDAALDLMRSILRVDAGHLPALKWLIRTCLDHQFHNQASYHMDSFLRQAVRLNRLDEYRLFIESCFTEVQKDLCQEYLDRIDSMVSVG